MKFCSNCGSQLMDDAKFCSFCGVKVVPDTVSKTDGANITEGEISLRIKRVKAFTAALMPFRIMINGVNRGTLMVGQEMTLSVPRENMRLDVEMVGNNLTFAPLKAETIIAPGTQHTYVECEVKTVFQSKGLVNIFNAVGRIEVDVFYR